MVNNWALLLFTAQLPISLDFHHALPHAVLHAEHFLFR
jgi:hypothetical protein